MPLIEFHKAPIKYTMHASNRLKERFRMKTDEVRHYLKTGRNRTKSSLRSDFLEYIKLHLIYYKKTQKRWRDWNHSE